MSRTLTLIILTVFSLTLFLSGCGEDDDLISTSIDIPIRLAPANSTNFMAQGGWGVKITIEGSDMSPITKNQNFAVVPRSGLTRDITIDNIPVGFNRTVTVEILYRFEFSMRG